MAVIWTMSKVQLQVISYYLVHFMLHIEGVEQSKIFKIIGLLRCNCIWK